MKKAILILLTILLNSCIFETSQNKINSTYCLVVREKVIISDNTHAEYIICVENRNSISVAYRICLIDSANKFKIGDTVNIGK